MSKRPPLQINREPSQRQRKVSEAIRHALSEAFLYEVFYQTPLEGVSITITKVSVAPDLRNATVYVVPLGLNRPMYFEETLNDMSAHFRHSIARKLNLRFAPRLHFSRDNTFEEVSRVDALLASLTVCEQTLEEADSRF
jgi:ribosome-binding factor A